MDEYLSEKEQIEQIRQWWRENGWFLVGGALLAGLGYFGFAQYQAHKLRVAEEAAELYYELSLVVEDDDRERADELLGNLAADYAGSPYLDQARLLIAQDNLLRDVDRAISELEAVVSDSRDPGLALIARLRLARVLAYDEEYDRALAVLDVEETGEFAARFSEVRGDIHAATGNTQAAITAYTDAMLGSSQGVVNQSFVELKLNDLIQAESPAAEDAE